MPRKKKTEENVETTVNETTVSEPAVNETPVTETPAAEAEVQEEKVQVNDSQTEETAVNDAPAAEAEPQKDKKKISLRFSIKNTYERIKSNMGLMLGTFFASVVVVVLLAVVVFFAAAEGPEKVMVPEVKGKKLETALLEMQVKELYPKISLRYSDVPGDEGTILDQSPKAGSIVKGNSRVSLVVSRGVVANQVGNYVGLKLDEMRMNLQTLFAGTTKPLILIGDISYEPNTADAGTILEQDPPEGTSITDPVRVNLLVSRGPQYENTKPPYLVGNSINDVLQTITRSKLIFDFTAHIAGEGEVAGTVVSQKLADAEDDTMPEFVKNYTHMILDIALPEKSEDSNVTGIFSVKLDLLPYAVPMRLDAVPEEGDSYTIISFNHTGGELTLPYIVPSGTTLVLYNGDKVAAKETVH